MSSWWISMKLTCRMITVVSVLGRLREGMDSISTRAMLARVTLNCPVPTLKLEHYIDCQHSSTLMAGFSLIWSREANMHKVVHTFRDTS